MAPPEPLFEVQGYPTLGLPGDAARSLGDVPGFRCPAARSASCVTVESNGEKKHLVFTVFDAAQGKKRTPVEVDVPDEPAWALSPDGSRVALTWFDTQAATVRIIPLAGGKPNDISVKGVTELTAVAWASDGKSFFVVRNSSKGSLLLHVNSNGDSQVLYRAGWDVFQLSPSPDGRYLAYGAINANSSVWTIPNLPAP